MRTLMFCAAALLASVGCSEKKKAPPTEQYAKFEGDLPEISIDEVAAGLEAKTLTVVDCNSDKTRKKHGILPGAILIDDEETFPASVLPTDKTAKLAFYCGGPG